MDVSLGRAQYQLGHGLLLWDGAAEGGSRGGYWSNARKAFEFAAIARVKPGPHLGEFFYLDKDELDESDSGTRVWAATTRYSRGENTTLGVTYMKLFAHEDIRPGTRRPQRLQRAGLYRPFAEPAGIVVRIRVRLRAQR